MLENLVGNAYRLTLPAVGVPASSDAPNLKRLILPQGELAQIHNSDPAIQYIAVIELRPGTLRGNHVHRVKREYVYLIDGEATLRLDDLGTGAKQSLVLAAGDLVFLPPGVAHAFLPHRPGRAIEFSPDRHDPTDSRRHVVSLTTAD